MTEKTQELETRGAARRRLVRGAFAAPTVLTLYSGSALAATSALNCIVKRNTAPLTGIAPTAANDGVYFRYRLWALWKINNHSKVSYWIRGADLAAFVRQGQTPWLGSSSWQGFNTTNNTLGSIGTPTAGSGQELVQQGPYIVLRVSNSGALVGAGDTNAAGSGTALHNSCWTSFYVGTAP